MSNQDSNWPEEPTEAEEVELLERMQADDEAAFEEFVRRYGPRVLAVTRRFLNNDQDAQDAWQDTFLSAFRAIDRFQGNSRLSTWLHRIAVNASLMKIRKRKRRQERSIDDLLPKFGKRGEMLGSSQEWAVTHDTAIADRELREFVRSSIDELPETYRAVLMLRDIDEHNTEETAEMLGISPGAVKTRLHRARQALRTLLDRRLGGNGS